MTCERDSRVTEELALEPEQTALYHIWGAAELLLYIGISDDFGRRWKQHAKQQPWWGEKRRLTVDEWFDRREDAEAAEAAAVKAEKPKYNKKLIARIEGVKAPSAGLRPAWGDMLTAYEAGEPVEIMRGHWRRLKVAGVPWISVSN